jgi:transcriptional regulator with XRE-family HTH domain
LDQEKAMRDIDEIISSLPKDRQDKINARAARHLDAVKAAKSLADVRKAFGFTQKELADALKVNQNSVSQMEARSDVFLSTVRNVAVALGYELELSLRSPDGRRVALPNFQPWNADAAAGAMSAKGAKKKAPPAEPAKRAPRSRVAEGARASTGIVADRPGSAKRAARVPR